MIVECSLDAVHGRKRGEKYTMRREVVSKGT
jgi:hypothetical protein